MFIPSTDKYDFPNDTSAHYLKVKMDRGIIFDKNYPYIDNSFSFKFKRFWVRLLLRIIVFPITRINMGLKIKGKKNLKLYKKELSNGFVSVANHVAMWDYICIMKVLHHIRWTYLLSWDKNVNGESGPLVRMVGGIPIPEKDLDATIAFNHAIKNLLDNKGILHIYPEGSMWEFYTPIRPFKIGAAAIAIKHNKPILPMAFSYRKPSWIGRKIFKKNADFTLHIGKPLYANQELDKSAQIDDLTIRAHRAVCLLAGVKDNPYEPIYNNSKKIEK